jgi:hypothetical protein
MAADEYFSRVGREVFEAYLKTLGAHYVDQSSTSVVRFRPGYPRSKANESFKPGVGDCITNSAVTLTRRNGRFIGESLKGLVSSGNIDKDCLVIFLGCNTGLDKTQVGMLSQVAVFSGLTTVGTGGYGSVTRNGEISSLYLETTKLTANDPGHPAIPEGPANSASEDNTMYLFRPARP